MKASKTASKPAVRPRQEGVRRRRMGAGVACLILLGLTLAALGHVAVQASHLEVALALGKEQKLQGELMEQRRRLSSDIGRLKEPGRISTMAREKLNMGPVAPTNIVVRRP